MVLYGTVRFPRGLWNHFFSSPASMDGYHGLPFSFLSFYQHDGGISECDIRIARAAMGLGMGWAFIGF